MLLINLRFGQDSASTVYPCSTWPHQPGHLAWGLEDPFQDGYSTDRSVAKFRTPGPRRKKETRLWKRVARSSWLHSQPCRVHAAIRLEEGAEARRPGPDMATSALAGESAVREASGSTLPLKTAWVWCTVTYNGLPGSRRLL